MTASAGKTLDTAIIPLRQWVVENNKNSMKLLENLYRVGSNIKKELVATSMDGSIEMIRKF